MSLESLKGFLLQPQVINQLVGIIQLRLEMSVEVRVQQIANTRPVEYRKTMEDPLF